MCIIGISDISLIYCEGCKNMTREELKEYEKSAEAGDMFSIYLVGENYLRA